ncbi:dethiobiotin synthase [bacterium]|nr:dethiobiotin synthase [bacterium]
MPIPKQLPPASGSEPPDDSHTPFVHCAPHTRAGEPFPIAVRVGHVAEHTDDPEHYIPWVQLWSGERLLAEARFAQGLLGGQGACGNATVTFNLVPAPGTLDLTALAYCNRHGLWESAPVRVEVEAPTED